MSFMNAEDSKAFIERQLAEEERQLANVYRSLFSDPRFGLQRLVDWDAVAMTEIESVNSQPVGGIDRTPSNLWRTRGTTSS